MAESIPVQKKMVTVTIDGIAVQVERGTPILKAAKKLDINIFNNFKFTREV